jgi:hypothetical protein
MVGRKLLHTVIKILFFGHFFADNFFATFAEDSKSASNSVFVDSQIVFLKNEIFLDHVSTYCKLLRQTRTKWLKKI